MTVARAPEVVTVSEKTHIGPFTLDRQQFYGALAALAVVVAIAAPFVLPKGIAEGALRVAVPITFAALGGIFSEKAGVTNIGLEGLLIISSFVAVLATDFLGTTGAIAGIPTIWWGFLVGVLASTVLAAIFAVVCIEFRADQVIAGLAVWLIALGLAPFASKVIYGSVNTKSLGVTLDNATPPVFAALGASVHDALLSIPYYGPVLFDAEPEVYLMLATVALTWVVLNKTAFGRHVEASGENPQALDTVGVNVYRIRYKAVLLSGVLSGIGGAALSLGSVGSFIGSGQTMVNGKGFIAIVAYLFGNYNPIGALGAALLFSGLEQLQLTLQGILPTKLVQLVPYVVVILVLAFFGRTRIPDAAGEHYEGGEER